MSDLRELSKKMAKNSGCRDSSMEPRNEAETILSIPDERDQQIADLKAEVERMRSCWHEERRDAAVIRAERDQLITSLRELRKEIVALRSGDRRAKLDNDVYYAISGVLSLIDKLLPGEPAKPE